MACTRRDIRLTYGRIERADAKRAAVKGEYFRVRAKKDLKRLRERKQVLEEVDGVHMKA